MFVKVSSWIFGLIVLANGIFSLSVGYLGFGVLLPLLSLIYLPPASRMLNERFGIVVPRTLKVIFGILIVWVTLAVGAVGEIYL